MSRFGGRFVPNLEHEVRRQATEPIVKWRQEWVVPTGTAPDGSASSSSSTTVGVKILKWVRAPDELITFPEEQDVLAEDRVADDAAIVEAPVQSIHNAPAVGTPAAGGSLSSADGGLGTIAPKDPPAAPSAAVGEGSEVVPASAIPAHVTQSTLSEPSSSVNTTVDNTPDDSLAHTPAASALEPSTTQPQPLSQAPSSQGEAGTATGTGSNTPQIQPQVESQLHDKPVLGQETDNATLAVLAAGAEAEQATAAQEETLLTTDPAASAPATTFEDEVPVAAAPAGDVEMKDA
ncbi:ubiquitin carboxyl-terminal hydrolase [Pseudozyma hubeiensis SY62]|uniref:Ubiquitin carboxyl-terminal hydrolase n=1 Tax=Pseudozyma hubeiensis (strain SY62) TaxID=1305764 RepID=R9PDY9_PSEHS|nr:ubiquitin carboxyl-terminal hydrolase [Pseudozyma hubeiensis SY62]GAC99584.1 ubiquitin carboxyl-terminal hydrolase [Pseudozyma hubeiensis SY62]